MVEINEKEAQRIAAARISLNAEITELEDNLANA